MAVCEIPDCGKPVFGRVWCQKHYARWLRHGDPLLTKKPGRDTGRRMKGPYVWIKRPDSPLADRTGWVAEHRQVAWDHGILTDPLDDIHHMDHDKTNNDPSNLVAMSKANHQLHRDVCVNGHKMTKQNTYIRPNGLHRECRTCMYEKQKIRKQRLGGT